MHPAEAYLRNPNNPSSLYVKINGKRRRLFINRQEGVIGIIAERKKRRGYRFYDWASIQDVYYPTGKDEKETVMKEVLKYKKLARLATHTNAWLRQIADADPEKSLFENHITTGTTIDGKCIRLSTIEKYCGCMVMECFKDAFKKKEKYSSYRFDFCGYDGTLWCEPCEDGDMVAGFMKEHRNTGNGYYYLLINDNTMIGYDID
ncbi:hypothetical protein [Bacteroides stercoris]|uniref:hypothetical protein n=1 Tax=Bacteroides stercoris TaxID=46506 RepID=UPI0034A26C25